MKKIFTLLITAIFLNSGFSQTTALYESFETWPAPEWNNYIYEGGGWAHSIIWGGDLGYGGGNCAKHKIWNSAVDDWLVSPQIDIMSADYELVFYEKSVDLQYYTYAGVFISTASGDPADNDFVEISESLQIEDQWVEHTIDLSAYVGESIYIAFVFQGSSNNWHHWDVDEVSMAPSNFIDGALTEIVNPTGINPVPGTEDVIVTVHNFGTDVINDIDIEWSINGVFQSTYQTTGLNLSPGADVNVTVGQYNFATQGDYQIYLNLILTGDGNLPNNEIEGMYYVTDPKDAELTRIEPEGYYPAPGNQDVIITVTNQGDFTIDDITFEWEVNGSSQSDFQASSLGLAPDEEVELNIGQYNFSEGLSEISGTVIVSGDEDLSNNSYISYTAVNILWESFEGNVFPPERWDADDYPFRENWTSPPAPQGEWYYISQTDDNMFGVVTDTVFTPLLQIQNGDYISIWVVDQDAYGNTSELIWKDGITGEVHVLEAIPTTSEWTEVTMDISAAAGINYIGFAQSSASYGDRKMDMISSSASVYLHGNDLGIQDLEFDYLASVDQMHSFNVHMRNYGTNTVQGNSYTIKLMTANGTQLAVQAGQTLQSWEEATIELNYTFSNVDEQKVYAFIDYASDLEESNNTSVIYPVYAVPADYEINDVGFAENTNVMIPFDSGGDTWTLGQDDISQGLYYQDELNIEGYLYGVELYYHELFGVGQYFPLQVSIKQTELDNLSGGWIPNDEMQIVFDDTIVVYPGYNSVYIPFNDPVLITGTNNLAIQYYQYNPSWPSTACRFYTTNASGEVRTTRLNNVYQLDVTDPPTPPAFHTDFVYTSFVFQPVDGQGIVSGTVFDENDDPIQGAQIEVEGTGIVANTNSNGEYSLPDLPYATYDITATYIGYNDLTQTITIDSPTETLDFYLIPLPQISIMGEVFGSNAPEEPLEGVLVSLDGYQNLTTYTNADGEFIFEDVYGNNEYDIAFHLYGYHDYTEELAIEGDDMDLGSVVLDEEFISAYNVYAIEGTEQALIEWSAPETSRKVKLQNDLNAESYSFTNEPFEEVWLGNKFENDHQITITSIEVLWDIYENAHDFVTIDILDNQGNLLVSSQPFETYNNVLMTIDVPNIFIEDDFYVMVHWQDNAESTDALTIDLSEEVPNTAHIMYPGEGPLLLSDAIGTPNGSFFVRANILEEDLGKDNREVIAYNVYKGLAEDISEADQWAALNSEPISGMIFIDETWSGSDPQIYTYAVEAIYVEDNAEFTFSNFISGYTNVIENNMEEVIMYPNPARDQITIEAVDMKRLYILNLEGQVVYEAEFECASSKHVNTTNYQAGIYVARIYTERDVVTKRFVVSR